MESVLLICHGFPPYRGVGGRRWAKLAKAMARRGVQVHVLCAAPPAGFRDSLWAADVEHPGIHRHELPLRYPAAILRASPSALGRIRHLVARTWLRATSVGSIYDLAIRWQGQLLAAGSGIIQAHTIKAVIATGAPFRLLYHAALLKRRFPDLRLLSDFRDPWLSSPHYGMAGLPRRRRAAEERMELVAVLGADTVTAPNRFMLEELQGRYGDQSGPQYVVVPHFYDPDDLPAPDSLPADPRDTIETVFGGTIYHDCDEVLSQLDRALSVVRSDDPDRYARLRFRFHIVNPGWVARLQSSHPQVVSAQPPVAHQEFLAKAAAADYALILTSPGTKDFLSSKYWELVAVGRPLLVLGDAGEVAAVTEAHQLGFSLRASDIAGLLPDLLRKEAAARGSGGAELDLTEYSLDRAAQYVLSLLQPPVPEQEAAD